MTTRSGPRRFPESFRWGTATAAHQIEGGNGNNDWWDWEHREGTPCVEPSGDACDSWHRWPEDVELCAGMGLDTYRFSLEWSRIEPEPSVFDDGAIGRYREILQHCHAIGLEPMVTLHHFSNPLWLVEKGDFNSDIVVEYFRRYTAKVVDTLGDLVPKWITINEPVTYAVMRYLTGDFPHTKRGFGAFNEGIHNLLRTHAAAYHAIKERYPAALVSTADNMQVFEAVPDGNVLDRWWAKRVNWLYNDAWPAALHSGVFRSPFGRHKVKGLAGTADFSGINYYTRFYVKFPPPQGFVEREWGEGAVVSDGNYGEVYPYGLYRMIKRVLPYGKPIYITENGVPDAADRIRPGFLLDHLRQVWHAISWCFPVMGYYHWSLVDNFEWERGWSQRFGLIALDPDTQERTWRPSARLYREICQTYTLTDDMARRYAPEMLAVMWPGEGPEPV